MEVVCPASSVGAGCQPDLILFDRNGQTHFAGAEKETHTHLEHRKKKRKSDKQTLDMQCQRKTHKKICALCVCVCQWACAFPAAVQPTKRSGQSR